MSSSSKSKLTLNPQPIPVPPRDNAGNVTVTHGLVFTEICGKGKSGTKVVITDLKQLSLDRFIARQKAIRDPKPKKNCFKGVRRISGAN